MDCHQDTPGADERLSRRAKYPAVDVEPRALVHETPSVRRRLTRYGVRYHDLPDVAQEVLIVAWREIQAGRYRPSPNIPARDALQQWLLGIAWRQASSYRRVAHRRYESVASEQLLDVAVDSTIERRVDARTLLAVFERVPRKLKEALVLVAFGAEPCEAAFELGISREAALARIRNGRAQLRRAIVRLQRQERGTGSQ